MKFIGNYNTWIDPLWEHKILTTDGQARPRDWPPATAVESVAGASDLPLPHDANVTTKAAAKITFFIIVLFLFN
jgi:hypothetical protein